MNTFPTKHIGIVAGTAEGAALCYRMLCRNGQNGMDEHAHPEVTMHTFPLRLYLDLIRQEDWHGVSAALSESAEKLARAGAELIICPNNTLHHGFDRIVSPVPWLHIADPVATEAARRGFRRVALLGTRVVMERSIYSPSFRLRGLEYGIPDEDDRSRIARIIETELIAGRYTHASRAYITGVISRMRARGCEAVVLGCTELPLLIAQGDSALPLLDSARLLADAALQYAAGCTDVLNQHESLCTL